MTLPARGFPASEFQQRTRRAQARMQDSDIAALLLTTEPEIRYYTGFLTRFWESPTRPWFVVIPSDGAPIAVIPAIGAHLMSQTWIEDIRTWDAPDYDDDGIGLLADTLTEISPDGAAIGMADALESHVRMPTGDFERLRTMIGARAFVSDGSITATLRQIKSDAEIAKIRHAVGIANAAFDRVGEVAAPDVPLSDVFRRFQMLCLEEGADWVPYLAGAAGVGGYGDVISPATDTPLRNGDVLMLDTGLVWDGYFCDFDRNFSVAAPSDETRLAHAHLIEATQAGFETAKAGHTMADLYHAMDAILSLGEGAGRLGHGLGMQLTEGASIIPADHTVLRPGMVLTLEPYVKLPHARIMVHEENIVIREDGPEWLSVPQALGIRVI